MKCLEMYYAKTKNPIDSTIEHVDEDEMSVGLKDRIPLNDKSTGYRNPFTSPKKTFVFNQITYHGYARVLDDDKKVIWSVFITNEDLQKSQSTPVEFSDEEGKLVFHCHVIDKRVLIFKVVFELF